MIINWDNIDKNEVEQSLLLAPGDYLMEVESIENKKTKTGCDMWSMKLRPVDEKHKKRCVWDNLVFTQKALPRVKMFFSRAGIELKGEVDLYPSMIIGKKIVAEVEIEEYSTSSGQAKKRNIIPFAGYKSLDTPTKTKEASDECPLDEPPF